MSENSWAWLCFVVVCVLVTLGLYSCIRSALASGEVTYCQVNGQMPFSFRLEGHRDWREDQHMGVYQSVDQAIDAAQKMGCKLSVPK